MQYELHTSSLKQQAERLRAGDRVLLSGQIITSRDAAHKRYFEAIGKNEPLPIDLKSSVIYYAGPTPAPENLPIGSCGPTTSSRMDPYAPKLLDMGLIAMIGKGPRSSEVCDAIIRNKSVYFCSIGGAGALAARCVRSCEVLAYDDLGCESVKRLEIEDMPLIVAIDCSGGNLFSR